MWKTNIKLVQVLGGGKVASSTRTCNEEGEREGKQVWYPLLKLVKNICSREIKKGNIERRC